MVYINYTESEEIGLFIAEKRKDLGLTQKELGKKINVSDKTISKWERGVNLPDILMLSPLSEALDVTITELLTGEKLQHERSYVSLSFDSVFKKIATAHKVKTHYEPLKRTNIALIILNSLCFITFFMLFSFAYYTITNLHIVDTAFYPTIGPIFTALSYIIIVINLLMIVFTLFVFYKKSFLYVFSILHYLGALISIIHFNNFLSRLDLLANSTFVSFIYNSIYIYFTGLTLAIASTVVVWFKFYKNHKQ